MAEYASERRFRGAGASLYSLVLPIPIVCFGGALLTDFAYRGSGGNLLWLNFSSWLIAAGLLSGAVATLVLIIELIVHPVIRRTTGWWQLLLLAAAWIVEFINALIHARDGWTAVVPAGLFLSAIGALLILISGGLRRFVGRAQQA